jgi:hypothetical protein
MSPTGSSPRASTRRGPQLPAGLNRRGRLHRVQHHRQAEQAGETQREKGVTAELEAAAGEQLGPGDGASGQPGEIVGTDRRAGVGLGRGTWRQTLEVARITKLRALLGEAMDTAEGGFELGLALRIAGGQTRQPQPR